MTIQFRESHKKDVDIIRVLLEETKLPTETLGKDVTTFYVAEDDDGVVGIAGFEFYGNDALLRSVVVKPDIQRQGLGSQIVDKMLDLARGRSFDKVVLLTGTAKDFFLKKGFQVIDRSSIVNDAMKQSSEFAFACPTSAVCMVLRLN